MVWFPPYAPDLNPVELLNGDLTRHVAQTNPADQAELAAEARTHLRRRQNQRVALAARSRHHHRQPSDSGDMRRNRIHQHRRRIGRLATRYIEPDAVERVMRRPVVVPSASKWSNRPASGVRVVRGGMRGCGPQPPAMHRADRPVTIEFLNICLLDF
jgi:hypothetical protein